MKVSLDELIKTGAHFGHQSKRWNPKMDDYLYGEKDGVHIFDLEQTGKCLEEALGVLEDTSKEDKRILFVGTKKQAKANIEKYAREAKVFWVNERWLGGTITNFDQIKKSCQKLTDMKEKMSSGAYSEYTKKERVLLEREIQRLERFFAGMVGMDDIPDVLVIIDIKRENTAVREAVMKDVTTIAIVDSNTDPTMIDYPIPMNDDATKAIEYVLSLMAEAVNKGRANKSKSAKTAIKKEK